MEIRSVKDITEGMIAENKNQLVALKIMERWYSGQVLLAKAGKGPMEMVLGKVQSEVKEKKEFITWLERFLEEGCQLKD